MTVFGTRPDTIKMAPLVQALELARPDVEPIVCVTAQHRNMLDDLLALFGINPDYDLNVMRHNQTLTEITTRVLIGMEPVLKEARPDVVLVHGDTSTSSAAALAAFYQQISVGHVEAGLRTHNPWIPFPEEMNRRLTGRLSSYHFAPTSRARQNLLAENIAPADVFVTGNTVIDAFLETADRPLPVDPHEWSGLDALRPLIFVTAHRRENHDRMPAICEALIQIVAHARRPQILWPVHPSPHVSSLVHNLLDGVPGIHLVAPMGYDSTVHSVARCRFVLTDSGGLQEEAPCLGKPVLVMRDETERPEGLDAETLRLVGSTCDRIVEAAQVLLENEHAYARMAHASNPYGDGNASRRIVAWLLARLRGAPMPHEFQAPEPLRAAASDELFSISHPPGRRVAS